MKQIFKGLMAVASAAVFMSASMPAQAVSFTVVIDKIELMENGNSNQRFTVYQPTAGVGESATRTIDLFDASAKLGTNLTIQNPPAGTFETMLVTFSEMDIQADTGAVSDTTSVLSLLNAGGLTGAELGKQVMILGDAGTGADSIGGANNLNVSAASPMPTITHGTGNLALPQLNLFLRESDVVVDEGNNAVSLVANPSPAIIASTSGDNAALPNVTVGVKHNAWRGTGEIDDDAAAFTGRVGLFKSANDFRPVVAKAVTFVSNSLLTDASVTEVTFIDVPFGTYLPLAWLDSNSNGLLDTGEPTLMADGTDMGVDLSQATGAGTDHENFIQLVKADLVSGGVASDVSTTDAAFEALTSGGALGTEGFATPHADGFLGESGNFFAFVPRAVSITVDIVDEASVTLAADETRDQTAASGIKATIGAGVASIDPTTASSFVSVTVGNGTIPFQVRFDHANAGATNANVLDATDPADVVIIKATADNVGNLAFSDETRKLTVSNIPVTLSSLDIGGAGIGSYSAVFNMQLLDNGAPVGLADNFTFSEADAALSTGTGNYVAANAEVTVANGATQIAFTALGDGTSDSH